MVQSLERRVRDDMNEALCKEFLDQEIYNASFHIGPSKALGPWLALLG
jgi:hypothetical protein